MPCNEYNEILKLTLDKSDCIRRFSLIKASCGKSIGKSMLLPYVKGISAEELLHRELSDLVPSLPQLNDDEKFLLIKQLCSLRAAISAFLGQTPGGKAESFAIRQIDRDDNGTIIRGIIAVDQIMSEIRACGCCIISSKPNEP